MLPQFTDVRIKITARDKTGVVIDLKDYDGIAVYVYQLCNKRKHLAKYSLNPASGYNDLSVNAEGQAVIVIPRIVTAKTLEEKLYAELCVRKADIEGEDGQWYSIATDILIDIMKA